jgi:hypothetical protein
MVALAVLTAVAVEAVLVLLAAVGVLLLVVPVALALMLQRSEANPQAPLITLAVVVAEVTTLAQEAQEELVAVAWEGHRTALLV